MKPDESALIDRLRAGDEDAHAHIQQIHASRMRQLALRILRSPEDAEEVVQDAFYRCARHIGTFRQDAKLSSWLYRLTFNLAITRLRRDKHYRRAAREALMNEHLSSLGERMRPIEEADVAMRPDEDYFRKQFRLAFRRSLRRLRPNERHAFVLMGLREMGARDAGRVLRIDHNTVKSRKFRGLERMKADLSEYRRLRL